MRVHIDSEIGKRAALSSNGGKMQESLERELERSHLYDKFLKTEALRRLDELHTIIRCLNTAWEHLAFSEDYLTVNRELNAHLDTAIRDLGLLRYDLAVSAVNAEVATDG